MDQLRAGWHTLDELAQAGGVCTRTIRRDLEAIDDAYRPVTKEEMTDGELRYTLGRAPGGAEIWADEEEGDGSDVVI